VPMAKTCSMASGLGNTRSEISSTTQPDGVLMLLGRTQEDKHARGEHALLIVVVAAVLIVVGRLRRWTPVWIVRFVLLSLAAVLQLIRSR
jgi:hypothetical protein